MKQPGIRAKVAENANDSDRRKSLSRFAPFVTVESTVAPP
jgi:hypothetical protein